MAIQAPTGTQDILPEDIPRWRALESAARTVSERYGYQEIRTPMLEYTRLFSRSVGEATDIVEKEMYTFDPASPDSVTFRPELTAPVVRAAIEHSLFAKRGFQKLFYLGPLFRRERPQKGRLRQFHQFGIEAVGAVDPLLDVETLLLAAEFYRTAGVREFGIRYNSTGCSACRPAYREALRSKFEPVRAQLCENCQARFDRNVFRILDCKREKCAALTADAPPIDASLCEGCRAHDARVWETAKSSGLALTRSPRLVRGLDYYTKTVYEFASDRLGAQDALGGGGRYDTLVPDLGGPAVGGIGFAIGLERVLLVLASQAPASAATGSEAVGLDAYVISIAAEVRPMAFDIVSRLRAAGIAADMDFEARSVKAQFRQADRLKVRWALILGPDEAAQGKIKIKPMQAGGPGESVETLDAAVSRIRAASPQNAPQAERASG